MQKVYRFNMFIHDYIYTINFIKIYMLNDKFYFKKKLIHEVMKFGKMFDN